MYRFPRGLPTTPYESGTIRTLNTVVVRSEFNEAVTTHNICLPCWVYYSTA